MSTEHDMRQKFWTALKTDRTMFLGLAQGADGHARPMTAQLDDGGKDNSNYMGAIWFFTSTDTGLYQAIADEKGGTARAMAHFVSKGHDVWATVHGGLSVCQDQVVIDRLWNKFVAAWYEGGRGDPKLALIRLDAEQAEVWVDASSIVTGLKMMLGMDPKADVQDKTAKISL